MAAARYSPRNSMPKSRETLRALLSHGHNRHQRATIFGTSAYPLTRDELTIDDVHLSDRRLHRELSAMGRGAVVDIRPWEEWDRIRRSGRRHGTGRENSTVPHYLWLRHGEATRVVIECEACANRCQYDPRLFVDVSDEPDAPFYLCNQCLWWWRGVDGTAAATRSRTRAQWQTAVRQAATTAAAATRTTRPVFVPLATADRSMRIIPIPITAMAHRRRPLPRSRGTPTTRPSSPDLDDEDQWE